MKFWIWSFSFLMGIIFMFYHLVSANTTTPTISNSLPSGKATWILYCKNGWPTYSKDPTYINYKGNKLPKDVFIYGQFWIQAESGVPFVYPDKTKIDCIQSVVKAVHAKGGKVWGVIAIDMDPGNYTVGDIVDYTKKAADDPSYLQPIIDVMVKEGYDGLINDIETGNLDDPQTFTQYNKNLHDLVKKAAPRYTLGIALDAKQPEQKVQWQDWGPLNKVTDFQIIMALDHYQSSSQTPAATSDSAWIKKTASYISKTMNDNSKVEWELPTYCKLWQWDTNTKKWILKKWCDNSFAKATLENFKKLPKKQQLKDNSQDIKNPYIHFIDKERTESYLFFETPQSLQDMASTVQSLTPKLCTHFSFWDFDKGDMNLANIDKKVKYC